MGNHTSHISVAVIDKAKANGVVLLTSPPHTSHKLQPLDRTEYGPLKKYFHVACNEWMLSNHGKLITIYEVAQCIGKSFPRAFKPKNILSGFRATGISSYDRNVFSDNEFLSSYVTDRPQVPVAEDHDGEQKPPAEQHPLAEEQQPTAQHPLAEEQQPTTQHPLAGEQQPTTQQPPAGEQQPVGLHPSVEHLPLDAHQSPVGQNMQQACCNSSTDQQNENRYWSPEDLRPYPKAAPRKATKRKTSKGGTVILTDTPVRAQILSRSKNRKGSSKPASVNKVKKRLSMGSDESRKKQKPNSKATGVSFAQTQYDSDIESDIASDVGSNSSSDSKIEEFDFVAKDPTMKRTILIMYQLMT